MKNKKSNVIILTPVYNDWESFSVLTEKIFALSKKIKIINTLKIFPVNDGSISEPDRKKLRGKKIKIIHLSKNVGHQKAIALGLAYIAKEIKCDCVIVMDADGEDKPEDIEKLLYSNMEIPDKIIFAKRSKRNESIFFKLFYYLYKLIFKTFTGQNISFGNFSIIPIKILNKLVHVSEIWNHYSSGVIKSKLPYITIPTKRGNRFTGKTKMNFYSFIIHGLSAISVQIEVVTIRILITTFSLMLLTIVSIIIVTYIKLFLDVNVPGWASDIVLGLIIFLTQTFVVSLILVFIILNYRTQRLFIPSIDYKDYIYKVENIN